MHAANYLHLHLSFDEWAFSRTQQTAITPFAFENEVESKKQLQPWSMGGKNYVSAVVVLVLVLVWGVMVSEGQTQVGECLIKCEEKAMMCAAECGVKGGQTSCYEGCGTGDIDCITSCLASMARIIN
ncbi:Unknown protein [Striga hermonthica]|uniref:Uncharacterized protein n=1 Tax=Striga hermonthica TaxID=68872 RepID=A0A9N7NQH5_STRHE|nr:Unknown protein [Striga hermonthica]